ncbi:permease [Candidatus Vecturithrix granuli]|uniref:Permease n=1 Tax=Vecturithrix granuli TaxID=1499967 RepID=A0A081BZE8_VECG1|nr:permease [Candidatus Vecturithrix granuli]
MEQILTYFVQYALACWETFVEMAPYICLGFLTAGILHIFVTPHTITRYLGKGRIKSVIYAAFIGIPLPLCSCGVVPAAAGLKKQGANTGAAMSFLIATPETGVDSLAVTYALLDPIMTIFRPIAAFLTAITAGIAENFLGRSYQDLPIETPIDRTCKVDGCCNGENCEPEVHRRHHTLGEKLYAGLRYGFGEILDDIAKWLLIGVAIAGVITVVIPENLLKTYLYGGVHSMLLMLVIGIPFYICATASTPIAAALILKGVSPGAALVFLLAGPATNAATISVVYGMFRQRTTAIYLGSIAICSVLLGLLLDRLYIWLNIPASAIVGSAAEILPYWLSITAAIFLLGLLLKSLLVPWYRRYTHQDHKHCDEHSCSCSH